MRKASLGTIFLTIFLDLLGFGMVIPFLPGVARHLGASDFVATLTGSIYSLMQFVFVPVWGRLSDRIGRRPVLLVSIAATALDLGTQRLQQRCDAVAIGLEYIGFRRGLIHGRPPLSGRRGCCCASSSCPCR